MSASLFSSLEASIKKCKVCRGVGRVLSKDDVPMDCQCLKNAKYAWRLDKSGIPPKFKELEFGDYVYKTSPAYKKILRFVDKADLVVQKGYWLSVYGAAQAGKSMLACCVLKALIRAGYDVVFVPFDGIIQDLSFADKLILEGTTFMCIDDITTVLEGLVNFRQSNLTNEPLNYATIILRKILSARAMRNLPTILTARVSIEEIAKKFPDLGSILRGNCQLEIQCDADDFRAKVARSAAHREFGFDEIQ